jgi:predicted Fe-Mo cluster-binding NifX family protein
MQELLMIVALPKFGDVVAPCFEVARIFMIARVEYGRAVESRIVECGGCEGFGRVQLLRDSGVNVLICNGIKDFYRNLLRAAGIAIFPDVSGGVSEAIDAYVVGQLTPDSKADGTIEFDSEVPLEDLVCWTNELFSAHGYIVRPAAEYAPFPVDLIAEINCPVCFKLIRVAICCGAHMYRPDQEIQLLHLVASGGYHARVYVHSTTPTVKERCHEYGVELIDPDAAFAFQDHHVRDRIPILQEAIAGHEAASGRSSQDSRN